MTNVCIPIFTPNTKPFGAKTSVFGRQISPFSALCFTTNHLLFEGGEVSLFQDGNKELII